MRAAIVPARFRDYRQRGAMDLSPCTDAVVLNRVANHPAVRPYLGLGSEPMDTQWILDLPGTVCLMGDLGGFIFLQVGEGVYSVHSLFLPEGRGGKAVRAAMDAVAHVFTHENARVITTEVPVNNPAAKWLALRCGFVEFQRRAGDWIAPDGSQHDMIDYILTRPNWEARQAKQGVH